MITNNTKPFNKMKKSIFLAALVLISAGCFAQKANVSKARSLADAETPDYAGARAAIAEALQNDETKDLANTWYVAGFIGYKEFSNGNLKQQLGQQFDRKAWGDAVYESLNYWIKAYDMAKIPTIDKKGREKFDTRTPKSIVPKVVEYFNSIPLIIAGFDAYQAGDPSKAYDMFIAHCNIPESDMMKENPSEMAKIVCDSNYYIYLYQSGQLAEAAERYDEALAAFERMNTEHAKQTALYDDIVNANVGIYRITIQNKQDTTKALAFLEECVNAYPKEQVFIQSLIDIYARTGQSEKALKYLDLAIQREPGVALYHLIKGDIFVVFLKQYDNAFASYDQAIAIEPNNAAGYFNYGVAYCEYADKIYNDAAYLSAKEFEVEKAKSQELNQKALPLLEKAYELDPDNYDYKRSLRSLYYRLGMDDKYQALVD